MTVGEVPNAALGDVVTETRGRDAGGWRRPLEILRREPNHRLTSQNLVQSARHRLYAKTWGPGVGGLLGKSRLTLGRLAGGHGGPSRRASPSPINRIQEVHAARLAEGGVCVGCFDDR